jgi:hypothetical protein
LVAFGHLIPLHYRHVSTNTNVSISRNIDGSPGIGIQPYTIVRQQIAIIEIVVLHGQIDAGPCLKSRICTAQNSVAHKGAFFASYAKQTIIKTLHHMTPCHCELLASRISIVGRTGSVDPALQASKNFAVADQ